MLLPASLKLSMHLTNSNDELFKITTITITMYMLQNNLCKHIRFMARLRGKPGQRINRNHTEVIQHPTYKIRRRKRLARRKPLRWVGDRPGRFETLNPSMLLKSLGTQGMGVFIILAMISISKMKNLVYNLIGLEDSCIYDHCLTECFVS